MKEVLLRKPEPQKIEVQGGIREWFQRHSKGIDRGLSLLATLIITLFCLVPLFWVFTTSLKPMGSEYLTPIELWPAEPTLDAYRAVVNQLGFLVPLRNSFIVSLSTAALCLVVSAPAAYAVARLRFRYKVESLVLLQLGAMIPPVVTIAPTFVLLKNIGLLKSLPAMIVPNVFYCVPLATWLLASYFAELPWELEDAAKVDGFKPFQIFLRVIIPLSLPGMFAAGMFAFIGSYGEFMLASVVTLGIEEVQTIPVAIQNFSFAFRQQWTWISAGVVLALLPVVLIVLVFQRWVIRGLTAGSVKY
jgi:multiple sugar transport system permease protein